MKWNSSSSLNNYESKFFLKGNTVFFLYFLYTQRFLSDISSQTVFTCWQTQGCFFLLQICFLQSRSFVCLRFCQPVSLSLQWKDCPKIKECEQQNLVDKRVVYVYCGVWIPGLSLRQEKEKVILVLVKETKKCNRNIKINLQDF